MEYLRVLNNDEKHSFNEIYEQIKDRLLLAKVY